MTTPAISIEAQFLNWSETATGGAKIVLQISGEDLDHFRMMTRKDGKKAGQRLALAIVRIGDDERAMPLSTALPDPIPADKPKGAALAKLAGMLCDQDGFRRWMARTHPGEYATAYMQSVSGEPLEVVAAAMRSVCGIRSRAELDHDPEAAEKFHRYIRLPYSKFAGQP